MNTKTIYDFSAGGMVFRKTERGREWLLIQHVGGLHWGFPKGHIGDTIHGEKEEEAALREVLEEGGVQAAIISRKPIETKYYFKAQNTLHTKTVNYFLMKYVSGDPADHDHEVVEAMFVAEDKVMEKITFKSDKDAFEEALKKL